MFYIYIFMFHILLSLDFLKNGEAKPEIVSFHVSLFSWCTLFVLRFFSWRTLFMLNSFHVALFSCCSFHCSFFQFCAFFVLYFIYVALVSCCALSCCFFSWCTNFMLFFCWTLFMLHFLRVAMSFMNFFRTGHLKKTSER